MRARRVGRGRTGRGWPTSASRIRRCNWSSKDAIEAIRYNEERVKLLTTSMLATAKNWHLAPAGGGVAGAVRDQRGGRGDPDGGDRRSAALSPRRPRGGGVSRAAAERGVERRPAATGFDHQGRQREARRVLIEAAWCLPLPPQVSKAIEGRREGLPAALRAKVWKTHNRLYRRYWHLRKVGNKRSTVAVTAVARELAGVVWAVACWAMDPSAAGGRGVARRRRPGDRCRRASRRRKRGSWRRSTRADAGRGGGGNRRSRTRSIRRSSNRPASRPGPRPRPESAPPDADGRLTARFGAARAQGGDDQPARPRRARQSTPAQVRRRCRRRGESSIRPFGGAPHRRPCRRARQPQS